MSDIFGRTEVLPSWLRDDGSRAMQGFQVGLQAAGAVQQNKQRGIENQRAERRMTIEEDQAETRKLLAESQVEGQRLKVDEAKAFAQDTPAILEAGRAFQQAFVDNKPPEEFGQIASSFSPKIKSLQGQQAFEKVQSVWEGKMSERRIQNYSTFLRQEETDAAFVYGPDKTLWPEDVKREIRFNAAAKADPKAAMKYAQAEDVAGIRAEASRYGVDGRAISTGFGGAAGVRAREGLESMVKALEGSGIYVPETYKQDAFQAAVRGGMSASNANADTIKAVESENQAFQLIDNALLDVDKFNEKYGENAFSEYVGPIDAYAKRLQADTTPSEKLSQKDKDARASFRKVNRIIQGYRRGEFGTALTSNETETFKQIIPDNTKADYIEGLRTFRDGGKQRLGVILADHVMDPNIRLPIKVRFLKGNEMFQKDQEAGATTATPSRLAPAASERSFNTMQEAEAANVPEGTTVIIGGKKYRSLPK